MNKEALTLALEALDYASYKTEPEGDLNCNCLICQATVAVKEALTQPEQRSVSEHLEPVATDWERIARVQNAKLMAMCNEAGGFKKLCEVMDKYEQTTPPQRTWVGLTDEDIDECYSRDPRVAARNAETKLKEKNT